MHEMEKELLPSPQNLGDAKVLIFPNEFQKLHFMNASALGPNLSPLKDLNSQHSYSSPVKDCTDSCLQIFLLHLRTLILSHTPYLYLGFFLFPCRCEISVCYKPRDSDLFALRRSSLPLQDPSEFHSLLCLPIATFSGALP